MGVKLRGFHKTPTTSSRSPGKRNGKPCISCGRRRTAWAARAVVAKQSLLCVVQERWLLVSERTPRDTLHLMLRKLMYFCLIGFIYVSPYMFFCTQVYVYMYVHIWSFSCPFILGLFIYPHFCVCLMAATRGSCLHHQNKPS